MSKQGTIAERPHLARSAKLIATHISYAPAKEGAAR